MIAVKSHLLSRCSPCHSRASCVYLVVTSSLVDTCFRYRIYITEISRLHVLIFVIFAFSTGETTWYRHSRRESTCRCRVFVALPVICLCRPLVTIGRPKYLFTTYVWPVKVFPDTFPFYVSTMFR